VFASWVAAPGVLVGVSAGYPLVSITCGVPAGVFEPAGLGMGVIVLKGEVGVRVVVDVRVAVWKKNIVVGKGVRVRVGVGGIGEFVRVRVIVGVKVGVGVDGKGVTLTVPDRRVVRSKLTIFKR
jgi:hypothetical protein